MTLGRSGLCSGLRWEALLLSWGGPAGVALGATVGFGAGAAADIDNSRIGDDFMTDVSKQLQPNRVALVAEIEEDWTTPVDTSMEEIGGTVFRRALSEARKTSDEEEVGAMKADLAQIKAEHAKAQADRKTKLQEKINQLDSKIQAKLQKAKERRLAMERATQAKAQPLKDKAAAARAKVS
jgi:uncharacterized membrane protein